jgi:iron complex transport system ATP-binding protein
MLTVSRLCVDLGGRTVLHGVSAAVPTGGWLAVVGPNGAGKSTLLRAVAGLVEHRGSVEVGGLALAPGTDRRRRARAVAYVPQRSVLPPTMTVTDYVLLGRFAHHSYLGAETSRDRRVTAAVVERLGLAALAGRPLGQLSGGEGQRAVLARALAQEAPVLVMDEPTTSLDMGHSQLVMELTDELRRETGLTVLWTVHDLNLAAQYADAVLLLHDGRVATYGPAEQVLHPATVSRYFGATVEIVAGSHGPVVVPVRPLPRAAAYAGAGAAGPGPAERPQPNETRSSK